MVSGSGGSMELELKTVKQNDIVVVPKGILHKIIMKLAPKVQEQDTFHYKARCES